VPEHKDRVRGLPEGDLGDCTRGPQDHLWIFSKALTCGNVAPGLRAYPTLSVRVFSTALVLVREHKGRAIALRWAAYSCTGSPVPGCAHTLASHRVSSPRPCPPVTHRVLGPRPASPVVCVPQVPRPAGFDGLVAAPAVDEARVDLWFPPSAFGLVCPAVAAGGGTTGGRHHTSATPTRRQRCSPARMSVAELRHSKVILLRRRSGVKQRRAARWCTIAARRRARA
jgi:hypothetical protein